MAAGMLNLYFLVRMDVSNGAMVWCPCCSTSRGILPSAYATL